MATVFRGGWHQQGGHGLDPQIGTVSMAFSSRRRAAFAFGLVGLLAGAAHVIASDSESLRLWREVLPLACVVGAVLGAVLRPPGWRRGASLALLAVFVFALAYAIAETAMMASRNEIEQLVDWPASILHWTGVVLAKSAVGALVAILSGAAAGHWLGRHGRR